MTTRDPEGTPLDIATALEDVAVLFPWMPAELAQIYAMHWVETGDAQLAYSYMQASSEYDTYFPGNRRDDGTLRYSEFEYNSMMEGYADVFEVIGLNPDFFNHKFVDLLEGEVSPDELYAERIAPIYDRVLDSSPEIRAEYARMYGLELTDEAIVAAAIDPELGERILNRQISIAEISGEGLSHGFRIAQELADRLYEAGRSRLDAQKLFGQAENELPILGVLAKRHADPDDDFDINEFTNAAIFQDPTQRRRIRRLAAQERQSFAESVGMGGLHLRDTELRQTGLHMR